MIEDFCRTGYHVFPNAINKNQINDIHSDLLQLAHSISGNTPPPNDIDEFWNWCKENDRKKGSLLYNGFKRIPRIHKLAGSDEIRKTLSQIGISNPALIDINCRIDSQGEEQYLFDWHQDYWFSMGSKNAIVIWVPVTKITPALGGLDLIDNTHTDGKIFKTKGGKKYKTYADAVLLDEAIPTKQAITLNNLSPGDALVFRFNVLHKSNPISSLDRSRFTIQLRFSDFNDPEFMESQFKAGVVNAERSDYILRGNQK